MVAILIVFLHIVSLCPKRACPDVCPRRVIEFSKRTLSSIRAEFFNLNGLSIRLSTSTPSWSFRKPRCRSSLTVATRFSLGPLKFRHRPSPIPSFGLPATPESVMMHIKKRTINPTNRKRVCRRLHEFQIEICYRLFNIFGH